MFSILLLCHTYTKQNLFSLSLSLSRKNSVFFLFLRFFFAVYLQQKQLSYFLSPKHKSFLSNTNMHRFTKRKKKSNQRNDSQYMTHLHDGFRVYNFNFIYFRNYLVTHIEFCWKNFVCYCHHETFT